MTLQNIFEKNIKNLQSSTNCIQNIFDTILVTFQTIQNKYKIISDKTPNLLTNPKYICIQNISLQISEICQTLLNTSKKNSHNILGNDVTSMKNVSNMAKILNF